MSKIYQIIFDKLVQKQLTKLNKNVKLLKKALEIIDNISEDPYSKDYKFEHLKYDLSGFCSKRLDQKNRIVYKVEDEKVIVIIISVLGHYDEL